MSDFLPDGADRLDNVTLACFSICFCYPRILMLLFGEVPVRQNLPALYFIVEDDLYTCRAGRFGATFVVPSYFHIGPSRCPFGTTSATGIVLVGLFRVSTASCFEHFIVARCVHLEWRHISARHHISASFFIAEGPWVL